MRAEIELEELKGDWTIAKKAKKESIDAHNAKDKELVEKYGKKPPSAEDWAALCGLSEDVRRRTKTYDLADRSKSQKEKGLKNLIERELKLVAVAHSPELIDDLIAAKGNAGPNAWMSIELEDICGVELTTVRGFEVRTISDYLAKRPKAIASALADKKVETWYISSIDLAVYNALEDNDAADAWPIKVPAGGQITIGAKDAEGNDDAEASDGAPYPFPAPSSPTEAGSVGSLAEVTLGLLDETRECDGQTIRILGHVRAVAEAEKSKFAMKEHGRPLASESKAVENVLKKSKADRRAHSTGRGTKGLFVLITADGKYKVGEFDPS